MSVDFWLMCFLVVVIDLRVIIDFMNVRIIIVVVGVFIIIGMLIECLD